MSELWYRNAIVYCVQVDLYMDGNGDGVGDFEGLTTRLDYIAGLGVNCIWLLPFYASPRRDAGFDVSDYYSVDPRLGTLGDFVEFARAARDRGIRILTDLVVHHCSRDHPWFQSALKGPESPHFDYFVWTETPTEDSEELMFPDEENSIWKYEPTVGKYYRHRFYEHQPDLNLFNPKVRDEVRKIMTFWLELGISGFRVDAAGFLVDRTGMTPPPEGDPYEIVREMRRSMSWIRGDGVFLAEANVPPDEMREFFDRGYGMHALLNFWLNQHLFLAMATESAEPLHRAFSELPPLVGMSQWANFLRNHDELSLGHLSKAERAAVFAKFAPEASMRIYGRGIRRRLAPMLGDAKRIEFATSLLLSLPGTPVLYYGDEIGLEEDLSREGRDSVRVPMQWAEAARLERRPRSLPNRVEHLIRTRKESSEIGHGKYGAVQTDKEFVFAHECKCGERSVVAVHNLSDQECELHLRGQSKTAPLTELISDQDYPDVERGSQKMKLGPYGYRWFRRETGQSVIHTLPPDALGADAD